MLKFDQVGVGTASTSTIGADTSGNNNHFTSVNIVASDCNMPDSPENNFCTTNGVMRANITKSEGNLKMVGVGGNYDNLGATFAVDAADSEGWYWEYRSIGNDGSTVIGFADPQNAQFNQSDPSGSFTNDGDGKGYMGDGNKRNSGSAASYGNSWTGGDIIGIAVKSGAVYFYKNGTIQASGAAAYSSITGLITPAFGINGTHSGTANFGQDSSFAGTETAQGNTDGNGIGDFYYAPPSGYKALCSSNLPEPTIGPNSATQSDDHHNTVLYTGNGADDRSISGVGFKPDWTWLRARSAAYDAEVYDSNRGATKRLRSRKGEAEATKLNNLQAFESDGFQVGTDADVNENNTTYVAWNWKANGGTTSTLDAGTIDATVQANQDAGFSIITFVSNQQASQTVAHGLGVAPDMFFQKNRDENNYWYWYVRPVGAGAFLSWVEGNDGFAAAESSTGTFGNTHPTDTLLTVGLANTSHDSGHNILSYCFASKEGFSKVGSYTGNGNDNGTFVFLGFKPAWIMIKCSSASSAFTGWILYDNKRKTFNDDVGDNSNPFIVNKLSAEGERGNGTTDLSGNALSLDFLSNGFKCRDNADEINTSGETYIFLAFAEAPFKYSNAR